MRWSIPESQRKEEYIIVIDRVPSPIVKDVIISGANLHIFRMATTWKVSE